VQEQQKIPLIILAQNGRFLAQSASQAEHPVWLADCFGDQDALAVTERWQQLPAISTLTHNEIITILNSLSQGEPCLLICGSGIESYYPFLEQLADNIKLIGNSPYTINTLKTPLLFFKLLAKLELTYPISQFEPPKNKDDWLYKSASGMGGDHIQYLQHRPLSSINSAGYYQQYISGKSGSVLFLADGKHSLILSINQQFISNEQQQHPFRLLGIDSAWSIAKHHQNTLQDAINKLSTATHLLGLNSLDFIIDDCDKLLLLEVNPRPSASAELVDSEQPLIQHHIAACQGSLPVDLNITVNKSLCYHYADKTLTIPSDLIWHKDCHDLPKTGMVIKKDQPIFTTIVPVDNLDLHTVIAHKIKQQF